jgi:hypothetical protein
MPAPAESKPMSEINLTTEEHTKGWRAAKESTSSEPSLPDFSHYISASYNELLADMDRTLREIPMVYGFAPDAWNPMTTCSIPKKANNIQATDQRSITLLEAQYNQNNKWYGRKFMQHNEDLGTIPKEQTGSRKGHSAAITALNKVLAMDLLRQRRQAGFLCSNDATRVGECHTLSGTRHSALASAIIAMGLGTRHSRVPFLPVALGTRHSLALGTHYGTHWHSALNCGTNDGTQRLKLIENSYNY